MREIKFRAWHESKNGQVMLQVGDKQGTTHPLDCCFYAMQGQPVTLMQYTGLKDKNGKEIFEGDILCHWDNLHTHKGAGVVEYYGAGFYLNQSIIAKKSTALKLLGSCYVPLDKSVVIGNIYENPELLEKL